MGTLARENFSDPDFPFRFKLERTASSESPKLKNKEGERKGGGEKEGKEAKKKRKKDTGDSLVGRCQSAGSIMGRVCNCMPAQ